MVEPDGISRIIAADISTYETAVCLFAHIDGQFRFVARSATGTSLQGDEGVITGLRQALRLLEHKIQVPLLGNDQELITNHAPQSTAFVACSSAAAPLRVVVLGLTATYSNARAERACRLPFVELAGSFEISHLLEQSPNEWKLIRSAKPDVIVLTGGFEDCGAGPLELAAHYLVKLYAQQSREEHPIIICAAAQSALRALTHTLGDDFSIRSVENVNPAPEVGRLLPLKQELVEVYEKTKLVKLPGYEQLLAMGAYPPIATFRAMQTIGPALYSSLGLARPVLIHMAQDTTSIWEYAEQDSSIGIRAGAELSQASANEIKRWLPLGSADAELIVDYLHGELHTTPTEESRYLAILAASHQALSGGIRLLYGLPDAARSQLGDTDFVSFHHVSPISEIEALLTILDTVQPFGASRIELDGHYIWPSLGAAACVYPQAAADIMADENLRAYGICIAPSGSSYAQKAVMVEIVRANHSRERYNIAGGTIKRFMLPQHEVVEITVRCRGGFSFYNHQRTTRLVTKIGALGLIIDTRGRPLPIEQAGLLWRTRVAGDLQALTKA
ncbi:MAG: glutamate mutase L [Chloroflexi bacterium]|nr:glutamate mutase L [Chloroflexota bacterium]